MDLKRWKIFQNLDSTFVGSMQSAYIMDHAGAPEGAAWTGVQKTGRLALMEMKNGDIYSIVLTSDDLRMLGVSEFEGLRPLVPLKIDALCGLGIRAVSSGLKHVAVVTMDGRIYEWGKICGYENWTRVVK